MREFGMEVFRKQERQQGVRIKQGMPNVVSCTDLAFLL